jgi:PKD repeat protein
MITKKVVAIIIILSLLVPTVLAGEHFFIIMLGGKLWDGTEMKLTVEPTEGAAPLDVVVEETSGVKEIVRWEWDFGDGSEIVKEQAAHHTYEKEGEFTLTLTVFNEKEEKASDTTIITVTKPIELPPKLKLTVTPTTGDAPLKVTAVDTARDESVVEWVFDFGDGTNITQTSNTAQHTYEFDGEYTVSLTVTNDKGAKATESVIVTVSKKVITPGLNTTYIKVYTGFTPIKNILSSKSLQEEKETILKEETDKIMIAERYPLALTTKEVSNTLTIDKYRCKEDTCWYWISCTRNGYEVAINNPIGILPPPTDVVVSNVYNITSDTVTTTLREDPKEAVQETLQRLADNTQLGKATTGTKE